MPICTTSTCCAFEGGLGPDEFCNLSPQGIQELYIARFCDVLRVDRYAASYGGAYQYVVNVDFPGFVFGQALTPYTNIDRATYKQNAISDILMKPDPAAPGGVPANRRFWPIKLRKDSGLARDTLQNGAAQGPLYFLQELEATIDKNDQDTINAIRYLVNTDVVVLFRGRAKDERLAREFRFITGAASIQIENVMGLVGANGGIRLEEATREQGGTADTQAGSVLKFVGREDEMIPFVIPFPVANYSTGGPPVPSKYADNTYPGSTAGCKLVNKLVQGLAD